MRTPSRDSRALPRSDRERVQGFFRDPAAYEHSRFLAPSARRHAARSEHCFVAMLPVPAGDEHVLEVGAGTGRFTRLVLARGFRVTATDVNVEMVQFLDREIAARAAPGRCRAEQADAFDLPYEDGAFDAVVCMSLIGRFAGADDQRAVLAEMVRVLRPGGWLVFDMRNPRSPFSVWGGKGGLSERALRQMARTMELVIDRRRKVHLVAARTVRRWPEWAAWLVAHADRLAVIPGLPAHTLFYRARRRRDGGSGDRAGD